MIERNLARPLRELAGHYPVVTVTGPRQSGKTTLCRSVFPAKPFVSLEPLDVRGEARRDPRGFLEEHRSGAILDEVQHVPELLSYLQVEVDERPEPGRFILTGSQHFGLSQAISQSLAGRTGVLHLLPPSLDELRRFEKPPADLFTTLWMGAYPRIHDRGIPADRWLADYVTNYVQRDVRQVLHVGDLEQFTTFLRLCAGRSACELNLSALGSDAGVAHNTARAWISGDELSLRPRSSLAPARPQADDQGGEAPLPRFRPPLPPARHPDPGAAPPPSAARRDLRELGRRGALQGPRARRQGSEPLPLPRGARAGDRSPARRRERARPGRGEVRSDSLGRRAHRPRTGPRSPADEGRVAHPDGAPDLRRRRGTQSGPRADHPVVERGGRGLGRQVKWL